MAIVRMDFFSNALYRNVQFTAFLPVDPRSQYGQILSGEEIKPVRTLYLLHGMYDAQDNWLLNSRIAIYAQEHNIAVIMPAGENAFYNNDEKSGNRYGLYVGKELVEFTRQVFPLSRKREDTFVGGLSMGGYGATVTALRYPETFSKVIALSNAYMFEDYPEVEYSPNLQESKAYYISMAGPEESLKGSENDIYALAQRLADCTKDSAEKLVNDTMEKMAEKCHSEVVEKPAFFMACGLQDGLLAVNRQYRDYLYSLGYEVAYLEEDGSHDWDFWDRNIRRGLEWL